MVFLIHYILINLLIYLFIFDNSSNVITEFAKEELSIPEMSMVISFYYLLSYSKKKISNRFILFCFFCFVLFWIQNVILFFKEYIITGGENGVCYVWSMKRSNSTWEVSNTYISYLIYSITDIIYNSLENR